MALKINKVITPEEEQKLLPLPSVNPDAYEEFLLGTYYNGFLTKESFDKAEMHYSKAILLDSTFIEAYCGLAFVWTSRKQMSYVPVEEANTKWDNYIEQARSIDPNNHLVVAADAVYYTWGSFEWEKAGVAWKKAIELNPNVAINRVSYAHYLMIMNDWDAAWKQANYAEELDPNSPWVIGFKGVMYFFSGKVLSAAKYMERLKKIAPNHPLVTEVYLGKESQFGNYDEAIRYLKVFLERAQIPELNQMIDEEYARSDYFTTVSTITEWWEKEKVNRFISGRLFNTLYMILDDNQKQLESMRWMYENKDPNFPYFSIRLGVPVEDEEEYALMMREVGLWE